MSWLSLVAPLVLGQTAGATLTLGEVEPLAGTDRGIELAARVLPPELAGKMVSGRVGRAFMPGQVWDLSFRDTPAVVGPDRCERRSYYVQASNPQAPGDKASADTLLSVGEVEHDTGVAILPTGTVATAATCGMASYISVARQPERRIAAYRVLNAAMAAARGSAALPFAITCRSEKPEACADPRAALATLPMGALTGINALCLDAEKRHVRRDGVVFVSCPPIDAGQPYKAEVRFGMSGEDGQSWTLEFVHRPGWPETIAMRRTTIIYH